MALYDSNQDRLRAELADMARNGSPETRKLQTELSQFKKTPAESLWTSKVAVEINAERHWQEAQSRNYLIIITCFILPGLGGVFCIGASIVKSALGEASILLLPLLMVAPIYGAIIHSRKHKQAYINWQKSKGVSEIDALRDYERKYSSD